MFIRSPLALSQKATTTTKHLQAKPKQKGKKNRRQITKISKTKSEEKRFCETEMMKKKVKQKEDKACPSPRPTLLPAPLPAPPSPPPPHTHTLPPHPQVRPEVALLKFRTVVSLVPWVQHYGRRCALFSASAAAAFRTECVACSGIASAPQSTAHF